MNTSQTTDRIRWLWSEFLYQSSPGIHTYVVGGCKCGESTRGKSMCKNCIAEELRINHGIDVTKPQWGYDGDGRIKRLWAVEWVCDDIESKEKP